MSLARREKIMLLVLVLMAAGVGLYFLADWYIKDVTRLKAEKEAKAADLQKVEEKVRDLASVEQKLAEARRLLANYERLIPKSEELPQLLRDMANILTKAGVEFNTFSPGRPAPVAAVPELNQIAVSIAAKGRYTEVLKMFDIIKTWDRLIGVTNFNLARGGGDPGDPVLNCQFSMVVYFVKS